MNAFDVALVAYMAIVFGTVGLLAAAFVVSNACGAMRDRRRLLAYRRSERVTRQLDELWELPARSPR